MNTKSNPPPQPQIFRADSFFFFNYVGVPILSFFGFVAIYLWNYINGDLPGLGLQLFLISSPVIGLLAYFPGNLALFYPYAVEVDPTTGITLVGPWKKIVIPISEISYTDHSNWWRGYVVHLKNPRVALFQFVIPRYFGDRYQELVDAIESSLALAEQ